MFVFQLVALVAVVSAHVEHKYHHGIPLVHMHKYNSHVVPHHLRTNIPSMYGHMYTNTPIRVTEQSHMYPMDTTYFTSKPTTVVVQPVHHGQHQMTNMEMVPMHTTHMTESKPVTVEHQMVPVESDKQVEHIYFTTMQTDKPVDTVVMPVQHQQHVTNMETVKPIDTMYYALTGKTRPVDFYYSTVETTKPVDHVSHQTADVVTKPMEHVVIKPVEHSTNVEMTQPMVMHTTGNTHQVMTNTQHMTNTKPMEYVTVQHQPEYHQTMHVKPVEHKESHMVMTTESKPMTHMVMNTESKPMTHMVMNTESKPMTHHMEMKPVTHQHHMEMKPTEYYTTMSNMPSSHTEQKEHIIISPASTSSHQPMVMHPQYVYGQRHHYSYKPVSHSFFTKYDKTVPVVYSASKDVHHQHHMTGAENQQMHHMEHQSTMSKPHGMHLFHKYAHMSHPHHAVYTPTHKSYKKVETQFMPVSQMHTSDVASIYKNIDNTKKHFDMYKKSINMHMNEENMGHMMKDNMHMNMKDNMHHMNMHHMKYMSPMHTRMMPTFKQLFPLKAHTMDMSHMYKSVPHMMNNMYKYIPVKAHTMTNTMSDGKNIHSMHNMNNVYKTMETSYTPMHSKFDDIRKMTYNVGTMKNMNMGKYVPSAVNTHSVYGMMNTDNMKMNTGVEMKHTPFYRFQSVVDTPIGKKVVDTVSSDKVHKTTVSKTHFTSPSVKKTKKTVKN